MQKSAKRLEPRRVLSERCVLGRGCRGALQSRRGLEPRAAGSSSPAFLPLWAGRRARSAPSDRPSGAPRRGAAVGPAQHLDPEGGGGCSPSSAPTPHRASASPGACAGDEGGSAGPAFAPGHRGERQNLACSGASLVPPPPSGTQR